jgi:hypothetical protein
MYCPQVLLKNRFCCSLHCKVYNIGGRWRWTSRTPKTWTSFPTRSTSTSYFWWLTLHSCTFLAGWPDWANFRLLGDCLLRVLKIFWTNAFNSPSQHTNNALRVDSTQRHCYDFLKTSYPGGVRTRVFCSIGQCGGDCATPPGQSSGFFTYYISSPNFLAAFFHGTSFLCLIFFKQWFGQHFGRFFTNSSGHPDS